MEDGYRFARVPLTPNVAAELIKSRFSGKPPVKGSDITDEIVRVHAFGGGAPARGDTSSIVKKALNALQAEGAAVNMSPGFWSIPVLPEGGIEIESSALPSASPFALPDDTMVVGAGKEAVYLYFLPTYKQHATNGGQNMWPCKIGRTAGDPLSRVLSQASTALPERPSLAVVVWTDRSSDWERAVQGVLAARGRRCADALGLEWFNTSPMEMLEIVRWIDPNLEDDPNDEAN